MYEETQMNLGVEVKFLEIKASLVYTASFKPAGIKSQK